MALRSNTDGKLTRATNLPVNASGWTMSCWCEITSTEAAYRALFGAENATQFLYLGVDSGESSIEMDDHTGFDNISSMSLGTRHFFALVVTGATSAIVYYRTEGASALTTVGSLTFGSATWTDVFVMGSSGAGEEWSNGDAHSFRLWHAALSEAECLAESQSSVPVRAANLDSALTLVDATDPGDDESGNNRDWTPSGTFATVDEPAVGSRQRRVRTDDVASDAPARRRLMPLAAFGPPPAVSFIPSRLRAREEALDSVAAAGRREMPIAAFGVPPVPLPPLRDRVVIRDEVGQVMLEPPPRRLSALAALLYEPPPVPPSGGRRSRDRQRGRDRWRGR